MLMSVGVLPSDGNGPEKFLRLRGTRFTLLSSRLDAAVTAQEKVKCATDLLQSYKQFGKGTHSDEELWAARRVTPL